MTRLKAGVGGSSTGDECTEQEMASMSLTWAVGKGMAQVSCGFNWIVPFTE